MPRQQNPFSRCSKCDSAGNCEPQFSGYFEMDGYFRGNCCHCMPKRICVHLDLYTDLEEPPALTLSMNMRLDCTERSYTGTLSAIEIPDIALEFFYVQDNYTKQCSFALTSTSLGYTGNDRLLIEMGGPYNDGETRRTECGQFDWEFPVTLPVVAEPYLSSAVVRVTADDLIEMPRNCEAEALCYAKQACITYQDSYGTEQTQKVCYDSEHRRWVAEFFDDVLATEITVIINLDNIDPYQETPCDSVPVLSISASSLGEPTTYNPVEAECPDMSASWDFEGAQRVSIKKDTRWPFNEFADCGCICRCICVTRLDDPLYATPPPKMMVGTACMSELPIYGCGYQWLRGWSVTLVNIEDEYDTTDILFWLEFDCETQRTLVYTSVSDTPSEITCPDFKVGPEDGPQQDISWSISPGGGAQPYLLQVRCLACTECTLNPHIATSCCGYDPLPPILTLEVTSTNAGCVNILGAIGSLIWNGDFFSPVWRGFILLDGDPVEFILTCGGMCGTAWCLSGCSDLTQQGEGTCSPFELTFKSFGGCASCVDPAAGEYTVTITA